MHTPQLVSSEKYFVNFAKNEISTVINKMYISFTTGWGGSSLEQCGSNLKQSFIQNINNKKHSHGHLCDLYSSLACNHMIYIQTCERCSKEPVK